MKIIKGLGIQIVIAMILGIIVGILMKDSAQMFSPLGDIFISLIKMLVVPLVAFSVIGGASSIGDAGRAGKVGIVTFLYYMGTTVIAVVLGLLFGEMFGPGNGLDLSSVKHLFSVANAGSGETPSFWETILGIIPVNPIKSFTDGNILQILFFCLFLGFGISSLQTDKRESILSFVNSVTDAMIWMIKKVMIVAPIGVFGLMASSVGTFGYDVLLPIVKLFFVYLLVILLHGFGVYPILLKLFSKVSIKEFYKKMSRPQLVALSTSSSMATLPITFETCEEELGVKKSTCSFVLPLGATINMDGNAIYYALCAVFFAQFFGIDLTLGQYIAIIVTATVGSIGQAGVPGPSLLVVAVLLSAGIPIEGLPLLYAADRIFDMIRTALNITGDASCAVIVDGL